MGRRKRAKNFIKPSKENTRDKRRDQLDSRLSLSLSHSKIYENVTEKPHNNTEKFQVLQWAWQLPGCLLFGLQAALHLVFCVRHKDADFSSGIEGGCGTGRRGTGRAAPLHKCKIDAKGSNCASHENLKQTESWKSVCLSKH